MRKLALALAVGLVALASGVNAQTAAAAVAAPQVKVVIVVGATESTTSTYRTDADYAASVFAQYTSNIVKVYSPYATWTAVQAAAQGANILVYLGHGSGYPNPYNSKPVAGDNGMGLNATSGNGDSNTQYYGAGYMAQLGLAANAIVLLQHLCYASGNSEWGYGAPTLSVAQTRVDGYASGFLSGNARAVIAEGVGSLSSYIDALFTQHETIDQMWRAAPDFHNNVTSWGSSYSRGFTSAVDPDYAHPQSDGDPYYRSLVTAPGFTTDAVVTVPTYAPTTYHALPPTRILDTRNGIGLSGALVSHVAQTFAVTGQAGVPAGATAVTGNLTVTGQTSLGYLSLGPTAMNYPISSTLNFPVGDDRANGVTVALGAGGTLSLTYNAVAGATAHAIFDVSGYFTPDTSGSTYHAVSPARLLDTRNGTGGISGPLSSHVARSFGLTGGGSPIPAGATAVTGNLTVTGQTSGGYFFIGPDGTNDPTSSTLNFPVRDDRANNVTVALGAGGTLWVTFVAPTAGNSAHAIFDVTGYFTADATGSSYVPLSPARILDTRYGIGGSSSPFATHVSRSFGVTGAGGVPTDANAVTGNLTVTGQTSLGYLFIGDAEADNPTSSTLNFPLGDNRANGASAPLGAGGVLWVTFVAPTGGNTTQAIFDVSGYFVP